MTSLKFYVAIAAVGFGVFEILGCDSTPKGNKSVQSTDINMSDTSKPLNSIEEELRKRELEKDTNKQTAEIKNNYTINEDKDSVLCSYFSNGKLRSSTVIKDGYPHGLERAYYPNGQLQYEFYGIDGEPWTAMKYYSANGDTLFPGTLIMGKGSIYEYFSDGKIKTKGQYKNSYRDSVWTEYSIDGLTASIVKYKYDSVKKKLIAKTTTYTY